MGSGEAPLPSAFVGHTVGYVPCRHQTARGFTMLQLVVKKHIRPVGFQKSTLAEPTQKERLVDADIPGPQGADDTLVCRGRAGGNERGADRTFARREFGLQAV